MNARTLGAIAIAGIVILAFYYMTGSSAVNITMFAAFVLAIPFFTWLGGQIKSHKLAKRRQELKKMLAENNSPAATSATTRVEATSTSVEISRGDRIAKAMWFVKSGGFWLIVAGAILLILILSWMEVINLPDIANTEVSEGIRLAVFLILLGLVLLLISSSLGKFLMVLGVAIVLLYVLLPNTVAWMNGVFSSYSVSYGRKTTEVIAPVGGMSRPFTIHSSKCIAWENDDPTAENYKVWYLTIQNHWTTHRPNEAKAVAFESCTDEPAMLKVWYGPKNTCT